MLSGESGHFARSNYNPRIDSANMRVDWKLAIPLSLLFSQSSATTSVGECPGYIARNVVVSDYGVRANLSLAGKACNAYGDDIRDLVFTARYQAGVFG